MPRPHSTLPPNLTPDLLAKRYLSGETLASLAEEFSLSAPTIARILRSTNPPTLIRPRYRTPLSSSLRATTSPPLPTTHLRTYLKTEALAHFKHLCALCTTAKPTTFSRLRSRALTKSSRAPLVPLCSVCAPLWRRKLHQSVGFQKVEKGGIIPTSQQSNDVANISGGTTELGPAGEERPPAST